MPKLPKPPKKRTNKPSDFHEAIVAPLPQVHQMTRFTDKQMRAGVYGIWAFATVFAGVGAGLWLAQMGTTGQQVIAGTTVASANLTVQPVTTTSIVAPLAEPNIQNLTVTPSSSVNQATSGTPYSTVSSTVYQGAEPATALDPGFTPDLAVQGTVGTTPIE